MNRHLKGITLLLICIALLSGCKEKSPDPQATEPNRKPDTSDIQNPVIEPTHAEPIIFEGSKIEAEPTYASGERYEKPKTSVQYDIPGTQGNVTIRFGLTGDKQTLVVPNDFYTAMHFNADDSFYYGYVEIADSTEEQLIPITGQIAHLRDKELNVWSAEEYEVNGNRFLAMISYIKTEEDDSIYSEWFYTITIPVTDTHCAIWVVQEEQNDYSKFLKNGENIMHSFEVVQ